MSSLLKINTDAHVTPFPACSAVRRVGLWGKAETSSPKTPPLPSPDSGTAVFHPVAQGPGPSHLSPCLGSRCTWVCSLSSPTVCKSPLKVGKKGHARYVPTAISRMLFTLSWEGMHVCKMKISCARSLCLPLQRPSERIIRKSTSPLSIAQLHPVPFYFHSPCFLFHFFFFFCHIWLPPQHVEFPGQGADPSRSLDLS